MLLPGYSFSNRIRLFIIGVVLLVHTRRGILRLEKTNRNFYQISLKTKQPCCRRAVFRTRSGAYSWGFKWLDFSSLAQRGLLFWKVGRKNQNRSAPLAVVHPSAPRNSGHYYAYTPPAHRRCLPPTVYYGYRRTLAT